MKTLEQHIEEVMDWFDFNKIKKTMDILNWKWGMGEDAAVPEIPEMRQSVREYMKNLHETNLKKSDVHVGMGSGGFVVYYDKGIDEGEPWDHFNVTFELESWYTGE